MNVSTGGPHLLLFERDQQLTILLTSELQLAGYECHAARTAVEVFDAIARHPIRLVLVNLAQAAAGRREFWVALDAQRRGRGVQVLTFRCMNLAGYGADDLDDRSHASPADVEVDGMMGMMKLVEAVRARLPGPTAEKSVQPAAPVMTNGLAKGEAAVSSSAMETSSTVLLPTMTPHGNPPGVFVAPTVPPRQPPVVVSQAPMPAAPPMEVPVHPTQTYTDRIRAIIYPGQATWTPPGPGTMNQPSPGVQASYDPAARAEMNISTSAPPGAALRYAGGQGGGVGMVEQPKQQAPYRAQWSPDMPGTPPAAAQATYERGEESGLAQLSRMLREQYAPAGTQEARQEFPVGGDAPASMPPPISAMPLRASPIQDIPIERAGGSQTAGEQPRQEYRRERPEPLRPPSVQYQATPVQAPLTASRTSSYSPPASPQQPMPTQPAEPAYSNTVSYAPPAPPQSFIQAQEPAYNNAPSYAPPEPALAQQPTGPAYTGQDTTPSAFIEESPSDAQNALLMEQLQAALPDGPRRRETERNVTSDTMLLDIVQSLPPMTSPPPAPPSASPPVLSGRATRTLGSVLLEGHLVPQNRLEVAQSVQRMLRGVDLNYQLGEILLMFKLLTPDQLLAASLVSYGLISTTQISALGRIRQELHAIGLEYDLENLIILFRILTPEQLREVRASWS